MTPSKTVAVEKYELTTSRTRTFLRATMLLISGIRLLPILIVTLISSKRDLIFSDHERWVVMHNRPAPVNLFQRIIIFVELMTFYTEYRNIICLRLGLAGRVLSLLSPRMPTLDITSHSIGPGFCIRHGFGSSIAAMSIGDNCTIYQLVTIGYSSDDLIPTIGNNVTIYPGATIAGNVHLGDNCVVGANSLVLTNVPPNTTAIGVPARTFL